MPPTSHPADLLGLETLNLPEAPTFATLLERLYLSRYCGEIVLHVGNGVPKVVEFRQVIRVALDTNP